MSHSLPRGPRALSTRYLVKIAVMGALARIIMLLEFPLPIFPGFLKLDLSDLVTLLAALALGPVAGILTELVKCLIHLLNSTTGGVGDIANFIVGGAYVGVAGLCYQRHRTRRGAIISLLLGVVAMIVSGALVNYFITIPLYGLVLGWSEAQIVGMGAAILPAIHDKLTLILFAFCPFNLVKGAMLTVLAIPLYKRVAPLLRRGL